MRTSRALTVRLGVVLVLGPMGLLAACSGDDNGGAGASDSSTPMQEASAHDSAGQAADSAPTPDAAGPGDAGDAGAPDVANGDAGDAGDAAASADAADADASTVTSPTPALPPDASTVTCPAVLAGSLDTTDGTQIGRHSRIAPTSACGMSKTYPGTGADPSNPHLYDVYRFSNPTSAAVCFTFTLSDGTVAVIDAGADAAAGDASTDATMTDASDDATLDATLGDASDAADDAAVADASDDAPDTGADAAAEAGVTAPPKYMTAYSTFYPTSLATGYVGDIGAQLVAPQTMAITVPANGTVDVVVYAIAVAPAGVGAYTLSCTTP
jgi:hypothetical protein